MTRQDWLDQVFISVAIPPTVEGDYDEDRPTRMTELLSGRILRLLDNITTAGIVVTQERLPGYNLISAVESAYPDIKAWHNGVSLEISRGHDTITGG
jgi:hypothetical protein